MRREIIIKNLPQAFRIIKEMDLSTGDKISYGYKAHIGIDATNSVITVLSLPLPLCMIHRW